MNIFIKLNHVGKSTNNKQSMHINSHL